MPEPTQHQINVYDLTGEGLLNQADVDFAYEIGMSSIAQTIQGILSTGEWGTLDVMQAGAEMASSQAYQDYVNNPQETLANFMDAWNAANPTSDNSALGRIDPGSGGVPSYTATASNMGSSQGFVGSLAQVRTLQQSFNANNQNASGTPIKNKAALILNRFDGGINLSTDIRDINDNQVADANNVIFGKLGKIGVLGGFESIGNISGAGGTAPSIITGGLFYFTFGYSFSGTIPSIGTTRYFAIGSNAGTINIGTFGGADASTWVYDTDLVLDFAYVANSSPVFYTSQGILYYCNKTFSDVNEKTKLSVLYPIYKQYFNSSQSETKLQTLGKGSHNISTPTGATSHKPPTKAQPIKMFFNNKANQHIAEAACEAATDYNNLGVAAQAGVWNEIDGVGSCSIGTVTFEDDLDNWVDAWSNKIWEGQTSDMGTDGMKQGEVTMWAHWVNSEEGDWATYHTASNGDDPFEAEGEYDIGDVKKKTYKFFATYIYDGGEETPPFPISQLSYGGNHFSSGAIATSYNDTDASSKLASMGYHSNLTVTEGIQDGATLKIKRLAVQWGDQGNYWIAEDDATYGYKKRITGLRFYYQGISDNVDENMTEDEIDLLIPTDDPYLFCDADFEKGVRTDFTGAGTYVPWSWHAGGWHAYIDNIIIESPQDVIRWSTLNLHSEDEIKNIKFQTATTVNGIPFIGNIQYNDIKLSTGFDSNKAVSEPSTVLFAASPIPGTVHSGRFPIRTNRIPVEGGEIKSIESSGDKLLVFSATMLHVINVAKYGAYVYESSNPGMSVAGDWQVCNTPFGVAWCNSTGLYYYDTKLASINSLTLGKLDASEWFADDDSKIGYDPSSISIIVYGAKPGSAYLGYAYNFSTDSISPWDSSASNVSYTNLAVDHDGSLTTWNTNDSVYKFHYDATEMTSDYNPTILLKTKDYTFSSPFAQTKIFGIHITYKGGGGMDVTPSYRVNSDTSGSEGATSEDWTDFTQGAGGAGASVKLDAATDNVTFLSLDKNNCPYHFPIGGRNKNKTNVRSLQIKFEGTADRRFEIEDITLVYKEKRLK